MGFFKVSSSQVCASTTSPCINKDLEKLPPQLYYKIRRKLFNEKLSMVNTKLPTKNSRIVALILLPYKMSIMLRLNRVGFTMQQSRCLLFVVKRKMHRRYKLLLKEIPPQ